MPSFVPGRRTTIYIIQFNEKNPIGRETGWRSVGYDTEDLNEAKERLRKLKSEHPNERVRILKRETTKGGYSSL